GERFDDGDAATVRRVDLQQPPVRDRFAAAVGDAYVNNLIAARVAHRPGDPHHPAGQGPCVSDRVADQLSHDADDVGEHLRLHQRHQVGLNPVPGYAGPLRVVGN